MEAPGSKAPRIRVAALMLLEDRVVVVRHRAGSLRYHLLPGGGVNYGETLEDALKREVLEETGFEIEVERPLFINDTIDPSGGRHVVNITFFARITGGSVLQSSHDRRVEGVELVRPESLSELDLRPPMAARIIEALSAGLEQTQACYLGSLFTPSP